jgi:hypothetical protein
MSIRGAQLDIMYNAFFTNSNVLLFLVEKWTFLESGIPLVFFFHFFIKLIFPGLGFEPVTSSISMPLGLQVGDVLAFSAI